MTHFVLGFCVLPSLPCLPEQININLLIKINLFLHHVINIFYWWYYAILDCLFVPVVKYQTYFGYALADY